MKHRVPLKTGILIPFVFERENMSFQSEEKASLHFRKDNNNLMQLQFPVKTSEPIRAVLAYTNMPLEYSRQNFSM